MQTNREKRPGLLKVVSSRLPGCRSSRKRENPWGVKKSRIC